MAEDLRIEPALWLDLEELLTLQKLAFLQEAERIRDYTIAPLTETLEDIQRDYEAHTYWKAVSGERIIGAVRGSRDAGGSGLIGRLIVHPEYQGRGIGRLLLETVETSLKDCSRLELFTGHASERNLLMYERAGYRRFREVPVHSRLTLVFLEKLRRQG